MARRGVRFCAIIAAAISMAAGTLCLAGYSNSTAQPLVRRLTLQVPGLLPSRPMRFVLVADIHVHGPDMRPERVDRLVEQINRLHPDAVLLAGDFVGNSWFGARYSPEQAINPLRRLKARLGSYAVLGNNDDIAGASRVVAALRRAKVHVLNDEAVKVGPIVLGGLEPRSMHPQWADYLRSLRGTLAQMNRLAGVEVLLAHEPDHFPLIPAAVPLVLAGHTHCGQLSLPWLGPVVTGSDYGRRFGCGLIREKGHAMLITAGVGTSHVPLRLWAPSDVWVVDVVPN